MRVAVIGLGRVGLTNAVYLAARGHSVVGYESDPTTITPLRSGRSPITEAGVEELLRRHVADGCLRLSGSLASAVAVSEVTLVCVGTPPLPSGEIDLSQVIDLGEKLGAALRGGADRHTVLLRSTVPPGTTGRFARLVASGAGPGVDLRVLFQPEFMREGTALADVERPPYTVVGADDPEWGLVAQELWSSVEAPFHVVPTREAELLKIGSNAFRAMKVAFANELARIAQGHGVEGAAVMRLLTQDRTLNISPAYLKPGLPYGGSCLPKDLDQVVASARQAGVEAPLAAAIGESNRAQLVHACRVVRALSPEGPIGFLGLAFKAGTGDLRGSPILALAERLADDGREVLLCDEEVGPVTFREGDGEGNGVPRPAWVASPRELAERCSVVLASNQYASEVASLRESHRGSTVLDLGALLGAGGLAGNATGERASSRSAVGRADSSVGSRAAGEARARS